MRPIPLLARVLIAVVSGGPLCRGEEVLFKDHFDSGLSSAWKISGLTPEDYRVSEGGLEVRVQQVKRGDKPPMLSVQLPFNTSETVTASVEVTVVNEPLGRHEMAGLCLLNPEGQSFTVRKSNLDGYFVLAPGEVEFIGQSGEEGDPSQYTVKYWPADPAVGPLRIVVRSDYAYFQTGPSTEGKYRTYFHSAITPGHTGMGFGLIATGACEDTEHWVRFDNFQVRR